MFSTNYKRAVCFIFIRHNIIIITYHVSEKEDKSKEIRNDAGWLEYSNARESRQ